MAVLSGSISGTNFLESNAKTAFHLSETPKSHKRARSAKSTKRAPQRSCAITNEKRIIRFVIIWVLPKDFPSLCMTGYATDLSQQCKILLFICGRVPSEVNSDDDLG